MARQDIQVQTYNKIKDFLEEQLEPVYKSEIVKLLGVDYNSLNVALSLIKHKVDSNGRVKCIAS